MTRFIVLTGFLIVISSPALAAGAKEMSPWPPYRVALPDDLVTQREIDQRFNDLQREIAEHAVADQRAITAVLATTDARLTRMNELRQSLSDLSGTISERISKLEVLANRISINTELLATLSSRISVLETAGSPFAIAQITKLREEVEVLRTLANSLETSGGAIARQAQRDIITINDRLTSVEQRAAGALQAWQLIGGLVVLIGVAFGIIGYYRKKI